MLFRQLYDLRSSTYTYLLADSASRDAVLIDPVFELADRDGALLRELGLNLRYTLETHIHADHVTAAWRLRDLFDSRIALSAASGAEGADVYLSDGSAIEFGRHSLSVLATPGHTGGCVSYLSVGPDDADRVFSGDSLMIRSAGRTDFQGGSARSLYHSVHDKLFTLPGECLVLPGHDYSGRTCTSIAEEIAWNPRLGGDRSEADFEGYMANLGLPHPNQIDIAVPANLRCGRPSNDGAGTPKNSDWGPALRSFAGVLEVRAEWLAENLHEVRILDVREPAEYLGELGHIAGARSIPLGELRARLDFISGEVGTDKPLILVCRSGGRSAQASLILEKAGFARVANLSGGMVRWRSLGYPVD